MRTVVILTAIPVERRAVLAYLEQVDEQVHPRTGTIYDRGIFTSPGGSWQVYLVQVGMGNVAAAQSVQLAIDYLNPELLFFVGIAGGLKDVRLGDVIAANKIYHYHSGEAAQQFLPRPELGNSAHKLVQRAMAVASRETWQQRISQRAPADLPQASIGPIAAGEQVLASTASATWQLLHDFYSDALAVEMEGYGALTALHANMGVAGIVIRGISDTLDNKKAADTRGYQEVAARHASAFAFEMLAEMAGVANTVQSASPAHTSTPSSSIPRPSRNASLSPTPQKVCYSYAREDEAFIMQLKSQLTMQRRWHTIEDWDPWLLPAGSERELQMHQHVLEDDIFILGISPAYISSDDLYAELEAILAQWTARKSAIIPLLLRPINTDDLPIHEMQILPRSKRPISDYEQQEEIWQEISQEIKTVVQARSKQA